MGWGDEGGVGVSARRGCEVITVCCIRLLDVFARMKRRVPRRLAPIFRPPSLTATPALHDEVRHGNDHRKSSLKNVVDQVFLEGLLAPEEERGSHARHHEGAAEEGEDDGKDAGHHLGPANPTFLFALFGDIADDTDCGANEVRGAR